MKSDKEIRKFISDIPQDVRSMNYQQLTEACNEFFPRIPIVPLNFENQPFFFHQNEYGVDKPGKLTHLRRIKLTIANELPRFDLSLG